MKTTLTFVAAGLLALTSAAPTPVEQRDTAVAQKLPPNGYGSNFKFPLANGFPNPSAKALSTIVSLAGGLPPGAPPNLDATALTDLMVIATNELTEVAFFTELLYNVTNGVSGYAVEKKEYVMAAIQAIKNQEELHAIAANAVLGAYNQTAIAPCSYTFPVTSFDSAIALAGTFTDIVLGALQSVESDLVGSGASAFAQVLGSIIGQEGAQEGYFRYAQAKVPSSAAFLTNTNGIFAYNALMQLFIVPGSCPSTPSQLAAIPTLGALGIVSTPTAQDGTLTFSVTGTINTSMYVTYMSGQNAPVSVPVKNIATSAGKSTFTASFPFVSQTFNRGLTVAAVTTGDSYADNVAVAKASKYGPGVIEVD